MHSEIEIQRFLLKFSNGGNVPMKPSFFLYTSLLLIFLLAQTYAYAADIEINDGMRLSVNSGSVFLLCSDITIRDGGAAVLTTGAIERAGAFNIESGGTLIDGSGLITICDLWNNNSSFVQSETSTIAFASAEEGEAGGTGDTDGDGVADYEDDLPFDQGVFDEDQDDGDDGVAVDDEDGGDGGSGGGGCFITTVIP
jgi:hypothetical protein